MGEFLRKTNFKFLINVYLKKCLLMFRRIQFVLRNYMCTVNQNKVTFTPYNDKRIVNYIYIYIYIHTKSWGYQDS